MQMTKIIDMKPFVEDVNCTFIILEKLQGSQGNTTQYLVADETACIHLHIWEKDFMNMVAPQLTSSASAGAQSTNVDKVGKIDSSSILMPGDICRILNGKTTTFKSFLGLYIGRGTLERVGDFCMIFNESKNMSLIEYPPQQQQQSGGAGQQQAASVQQLDSKQQPRQRP
jgi:hypothetical protein